MVVSELTQLFTDLCFSSSDRRLQNARKRPQGRPYQKQRELEL